MHFCITVSLSKKCPYCFFRRAGFRRAVCRSCVTVRNTTTTTKTTTTTATTTLKKTDDEVVLVAGPVSLFATTTTTTRQQATAHALTVTLAFARITKLPVHYYTITIITINCHIHIHIHILIHININITLQTKDARHQSPASPPQAQSTSDSLNLANHRTDQSKHVTVSCLFQQQY
jgi:hypothetical protein